MIAWFAETFGEAPGQAYDAVRERLVQIVNARHGLLELQTKLRNMCEQSTPEVVQKMRGRLVKKIAGEVAKLEAAITALVKATAHFAELAEIIESVPGLAKTTSAGLIAAMPELGQVSNKVEAALLGAAPYDDYSGQRKGARHIKGGRRKVRNLFYIACLGAATQHNPVLKAFYGRLIAKGKEPKVALTAGMRGAHRDPQHHDRTGPTMGCHPPRIELNDRATIALGLRRALAQPKDRRADGVKAGSRRRRGRAAPALRPADHRSTPTQLLPGDDSSCHRRCRLDG